MTGCAKLNLAVSLFIVAWKFHEPFNRSGKVSIFATCVSWISLCSVISVGYRSCPARYRKWLSCQDHAPREGGVTVVFTVVFW